MPSGNLLTVALTDCKIQAVKSIDQARLQQKLSTDELLESLEKINKDVDQTLSASRKSAVERHKAKTHVVPYKHTVGDYVVVARTHRPHQDVYVGSRRTSCILSDFAVEIEHLLASATAVVHVLPRQAV